MYHKESRLAAKKKKKKTANVTPFNPSLGCLNKLAIKEAYKYHNVFVIRTMTYWLSGNILHGHFPRPWVKN